MGRYLYDDLQIRVILAIEGGLSRRAAAARFGIRSSRPRCRLRLQRCGCLLSEHEQALRSMGLLSEMSSERT